MRIPCCATILLPCGKEGDSRLQLLYDRMLARLLSWPGAGHTTFVSDLGNGVTGGGPPSGATESGDPRDGGRRHLYRCEGRHRFPRGSLDTMALGQARGVKSPFRVNLLPVFCACRQPPSTQVAPLNPPSSGTMLQVTPFRALGVQRIPPTDRLRPGCAVQVEIRILRGRRRVRAASGYSVASGAGRASIRAVGQHGKCHRGFFDDLARAVDGQLECRHSFDAPTSGLDVSSGKHTPPTVRPQLSGCDMPKHGRRF